MIATKLIANEVKVPRYIEDDSLLFKRENRAWGVTSGMSPLTVNIPNVKTGENAFTYCGTLPIVNAYILRVIPNYMALRRNSTGLKWTNMQSGAGITDGLTFSTDAQPYVVATLYFPTTTTQTVTLSVNGGKVVSATGNWAGGNTSLNIRMDTTSLAQQVLDLALVYNRVLSDEEMEQNYQAFLYRHRQED